MITLNIYHIIAFMYNSDLYNISKTILPGDFFDEIKLLKDYDNLPDYIMSPKMKEEISININDTFFSILEYFFLYIIDTKNLNMTTKTGIEKCLGNRKHIYNYYLLNYSTKKEVDKIEFENWYMSYIRRERLNKIIDAL